MVKKEVDEEIVVGDEGPLLVVSKVCFIFCKAEGEDCNISQSTCMMGGKVCKPVIYLGSYKNVVSEQAIWKLNLETKKDPSPYWLGGFDTICNDLGNVIVKSTLIPQKN